MYELVLLSRLYLWLLRNVRHVTENKYGNNLRAWRMNFIVKLVTVRLPKNNIILRCAPRLLCINVCPDICKQALPVSLGRGVTIRWASSW